MSDTQMSDTQMSDTQMSDTDTNSNAPSLQAQTIELGKTLKAISDRDPSGTPTSQAAAVFRRWLADAGPTSREPAYLADVADNYDVFLNTNKDLFELFDILDNYIEVDDDGPPEPRTYIGLPMSS